MYIHDYMVLSRMGLSDIADKPLNKLSNAELWYIYERVPLEESEWEMSDLYDPEETWRDWETVCTSVAIGCREELEKRGL